MKNEKGITLIALIITIIVMLVLVGVTINVAIQGNLFGTARDASDGTKREFEREELLSVAIGLYDVDNGIDQTALAEEISNLNTEYIVDNEKTVANSKYVILGPSRTIWQIDLKTGEVKEYAENTSAARYFGHTIQSVILQPIKLDLDNRILIACAVYNGELIPLSDGGSLYESMAISSINTLESDILIYEYDGETHTDTVLYTVPAGAQVCFVGDLCFILSGNTVYLVEEGENSKYYIDTSDNLVGSEDIKKTINEVKKIQTQEEEDISEATPLSAIEGENNTYKEEELEQTLYDIFADNGYIC